MKKRIRVITVIVIAVLVLASLNCAVVDDFMGTTHLTNEADDEDLRRGSLGIVEAALANTQYAATKTAAASELEAAQSMPGTRVAPSQTPAATPKMGVVEEFFRAWSFGAVDDDQVSAPTVFKINQAWLVTEIVTYHWNKGRGKTPGTIGLKGSDGTLYGPWQASAMAGSGVPTAAWVVIPNVVIPPGNYTVIDSDPSTWAQNTETRGAGMAWGKGIRQSNP